MEILIKSFLLCIFFFSAHAMAYFLSTGTYVPYFNKAQVSTSGATQKFALNPYFSIGTQYSINGPHYFTPELGYVYYKENAKKTRTELIMLHYNFSYIIGPQFLLRYGLTNNQLRITGEGGTVRLNNGNSYTDFIAPNRTSSSYFTTLDLGSEYIFTNRAYALRFDLNMMNFLNFENRAYNYLLTFNFYMP